MVVWVRNMVGGGSRRQNKGLGSLLPLSSKNVWINIDHKDIDTMDVKLTTVVHHREVAKGFGSSSRHVGQML